MLQSRRPALYLWRVRNELFSERSNNKSQHASFPFAGSTCGMRCKRLHCCRAELTRSWRGPCACRPPHSGGRSSQRGSQQRRPRSRLLWKTTTSVGMGGPYESAFAVQYFEPQVMSAINAWAIDAAAGQHDWACWIRMQSQNQRRCQNLYLSFDGLHFLPVVYEQMNDLSSKHDLQC